MAIEYVHLERADGKPCSILDVLNVLGNCSRLEMSALSPEAQFKAEVKKDLVCLSYYPEFFGISKNDFLKDILSAGYKEI